MLKKNVTTSSIN